MSIMGCPEDLGSNTMNDELNDFRFMNSLNLKFLLSKMQMIRTVVIIIICNSKVL